MLLKKTPFNPGKYLYLLSGLRSKSPVPEQYRTLRTNIQLVMETEKWKSLIVTSANHSEGKSTVAANLSVTFAEAGKKVLLIDANLREPVIHHFFNIKSNIGFSAILAMEVPPEQCIYSSKLENLDILPSGRIPANPSSLLFSEGMEELIEYASRKYDFIVMDTPEALLFNDAQVLASMCDGALLVAKSRESTPKEVEEVRNMIISTKAQFLGAVLND